MRALLLLVGFTLLLGSGGGVFAQAGDGSSVIEPAKEPQYAFPGPNSPAAPHAFAIISCRADDLTGKPGRHGVDPVTGVYDPTQAAQNWRDLELHFDNGALECRRELTPVWDKDEQSSPDAKAKTAALGAPGSAVSAQPPAGTLQAAPTNHNFGDPTICLSAATSFMAGEQWEVLNHAWVVVAIGCPTPIVNPAGVIVGWHLTECPSHLPGLEGLKCNFDDSAI